MTNVEELTDEQLETLYGSILDERYRRAAKESIPLQIRKLNEELLNAQGRGMGCPWIQPEGSHDAYPVGWTATHNELLWESLFPSNTWEPGESGWRVVEPPVEVVVDSEQEQSVDEENIDDE